MARYKPRSQGKQFKNRSLKVNLDEPRSKETELSAVQSDEKIEKRVLLVQLDRVNIFACL